MHITLVPCLSDNYAYLLRADDTNQALVVDPGEAPPVLEALERADLTLAAILNTHHHRDHVGGNNDLVKRFGTLPVYGHASDKGRIARQSELLEHDDEIDAAGLHFRILHVPGHTRGAVAYLTGEAVFTGDTLFAAGCGRLFEGTPAQMYESLDAKLGSLPDDTRVYCGHEYTQSNLRFAAHIEPGNQAVRDKAAEVAELRSRGEPTVPSTIGEERQTNPFMRCNSAGIIDNIRARLSGDEGPAAVLGAVRAAKDSF